MYKYISIYIGGGDGREGEGRVLLNFHFIFQKAWAEPGNPTLFLIFFFNSLLLVYVHSFIIYIHFLNLSMTFFLSVGPDIRISKRLFIKLFKLCFDSSPEKADNWKKRCAFWLSAILIHFNSVNR